MSLSGADGAGAVAGVRLTDRIGLGVLTRLISRDVIDEVLAQTGRAERRSRLLPARVVVYYVLALCLFFGEGYEEVMRLLAGGLQWLGSWRADWRVPTTGALAQARQRLGAEPVKVLFERLAVPMARPGTRGAWLAGRRLMAIDGLVLDVPDTPANDAAFGRSGSTANPGPFPQVRIVGLCECGTRAVVAAQLAPFRSSERALAGDLLPGIGAGMLVLADRGFYSYQLWHQAAATGADLLWRVPASVKLPPVTALPDGSYLSYLADPRLRERRYDQIRKGCTFVTDLTGTPVRVIEYQIPDRSSDPEVICLLTTILDPAQAPAAVLAAAYSERWEIETAFAELETSQKGPARVLRSRSPDMVKQEIWAFLLTHYAIRDLICQAADEAGADPDRLSFIRSLRIIRRQVTDQAGFSPQAPRHPDPPQHR
jgi:hypothetical protein